MFQRIGRTVVRHPVWTIVAWLVATVALVATAPSLPSSTDQSSFLPRHYESIQAAQVQAKAFPAAFTPAAMVLYQREDGSKLTAEDLKAAAKVDRELQAGHLDQVEKVIAGTPSKNGRYVTGLVQMNQDKAGQPAQITATKALRKQAKDLAAREHLKAQLGGPAAQALDQSNSANTSDMLALLGSLVIIMITLLIIFRSPLIAVLPLLLLLLVDFTVSNSLIAFATKLFGLQANDSLSSLLIVVLLGVGTDYFLFLMFRYRERLRAGDEPKDAMINAVARVGEAIASAAGAVIIAFLALCLSTLGFFTQLGPALAILVGVTLLAGLTLFPAVCSLIPPGALFWPSKAWRTEPTNARYGAIGRTVGRRPGLTAAVSGLLMLCLAGGAIGFKASFDLAAGSMPDTMESMVVQSEMKKAYPAGATDPTSVYLATTSGAQLDEAVLPRFAEKLGTVDGVAEATFSRLSADKSTARFTVVLKYGSHSSQAIDVMGTLRDVAHRDAPHGDKAYVGGTTSVFKDIQTAMRHDYLTVFPVAALLIMLILGLLLRSVVAPWYLMFSVGLGFLATLGATVLIFQRGVSSSGLISLLPVILYLFVVAIGTDYNILMIARLREEARSGHEPREAASLAVRHAGPTVAAAGFVLAATFATLMLSGNSLLTQMGFSVAFGIVVSAFVMATFFTPALTALIGHAAWWPGHADRAEPPAADAGDAEDTGRPTVGEPAGSGTM
jgi:putative drug exporter of the RND superfamily